ncbi:GlxA family transcriptional regulator [Streptomyces sp. NPDC059788]|uniref:GlxA family transcriptional regulator n=1 Tax=Streptomyces sp. NPDC059788 TaxID=3346948 RepID=UPI00364CACF9
MPRHVVAIAVTDATPTFELAVPCEVFGIDRSDIADPWYELRLCAAEPAPLRTPAGLRIEAPYDMDDLLEADTVIVAACARPVQLDPPASLIAAVRKAHELGRRIVSLCTGAYVLAHAGLLTGRPATTHWMNAADFGQRFSDVDFSPSVLYTESDNVFTSAGSGAAIDLCLHLVRQDHGSAVATEIARRMVVPPHREGVQVQYTKPPVRPREGDELNPVLQWARDHLHEPLTVPQLARVANLGERTFARRFREAVGTTPLQWLLQQRVRLAQELLETTDEPVDSVARHSGFGTATNLRYHFGRVTSVSPQTYRHVFRHRAATQRQLRSAAS